MSGRPPLYDSLNRRFKLAPHNPSLDEFLIDADRRHQVSGEKESPPHGREHVSEDTDKMLYGTVNIMPSIGGGDLKLIVNERLLGSGQSGASFSIPPLPIPSMDLQRNRMRGSTFEDEVYSSDTDKKRDLKQIISKFAALTDNINVNVRDVGNREIFTADDFLPPMDSKMSLKSSRLQRDRFFDEVEIGDIFCCSVQAVTSSGLDLLLLCYACKRNREIDRLKVTAYCSSRDIPELLYGHKKEVSDVYSAKDKVMGVVIGLNQYNEKITLSLLERDLPHKVQNNISLGLTRFEDLPASYKTTCMSSELTYGQVLLTNAIFHSRGVEARLCRQLGLEDNQMSCSLLKRVHSEYISPEEKASALRKQQSRNHALHSVSEGVKLYKAGKQKEAMSMYNKALDVDSNNVEALVARGAMYANNESYQRALEDFKLALRVDPKHQNALDYTVRTLQAYARDLEDTGDNELAVKCYNEVLVLDPSNAFAQEALFSRSNQRASSADQQPVISSTRSDTSSSPNRQRPRNRDERGRSREPSSSCQLSVGRGSRRSRSIEMRRKSIMTDRQTSVRANTLETFHNAERAPIKSESVRDSSSSSSSGSSTSSHYYSRGKRRYSSSSSSDQSRRLEQGRSHKRSRRGRSPSYNSRGVKLRRSYRSSSQSSTCLKRQVTASDSLSSLDRNVLEQNITHESSSRSRCSRSPRRTPGSSPRRTPGGSPRRTPGGSPRHTSSSSRYKSASSTRKTGSKSTKVKSDESLNLTPTSEEKPESSLSAKHSRELESYNPADSMAQVKRDHLDRYGMAKRDSSSLDIFSDLTECEQTPTEVKKSTTVFLPYCLTTDPIKKSSVKPFTLKKSNEGKKAIENFTIKAQRGQRQAVIPDGYDDSSKIACVQPSSSKRVFKDASDNMPSHSRISTPSHSPRQQYTTYRHDKDRSRSDGKRESSSSNRYRSSRHSRTRSISLSSQTRSRGRSRKKKQRRRSSRPSSRNSSYSRSSRKRKPKHGSDSRKKRHKLSAQKSAIGTDSQPKATEMLASKFGEKRKEMELAPQQKVKKTIHLVGVKRVTPLKQAMEHLKKAQQEHGQSSKTVKKKYKKMSAAAKINTSVLTKVTSPTDPTVDKQLNIAKQLLKVKDIQTSKPEDKLKQENELKEMEDFLSTLKKNKKDNIPEVKNTK